MRRSPVRATYLLTPLIRHLAIRIGAVGEVRSRDVHTIPTPRMGGLAMMLGFVIAMLFASRIPFIQGLFHENHQAWVVMIGAVLICLLGMADDLWDLDWMLKMAGQLLISVFVAWGGLQVILIAAGVFGNCVSQPVHGYYGVSDCRLDQCGQFRGWP